MKFKIGDEVIFVSSDNTREEFNYMFFIVSGDNRNNKHYPLLLNGKMSDDDSFGAAHSELRPATKLDKLLK